ncbi:MAG: hypothetical protein HC822_02975 [Oscillochloris sp.]|nr:hypothetical protein [Oscillochloris sp.]
MTRSLGLDGTIVAQTRLGLIDGAAGQLHYCGYNVHDLAERLRWEAVLFLLWNGELPDAAALQALQAQLAALRKLDDAELALIESLPTTGHGMDVLRAALSLLAGLHQPAIMGPATVFDDGLRLIAKFPMLVAAWARRRQGLAPVEPDADLGQAEAFLMALQGRRPEAIEAEALNCYMVLLAEHGLNVSTFVARVAASAQNDLYAASDAALATLKGVAHGGANEMAMRQFLAIGSPERVAGFVADLLARKER